VEADRDRSAIDPDLNGVAVDYPDEVRGQDGFGFGFGFGFEFNKV
jgi:hypothetical protein